MKYALLLLLIAAELLGKTKKPEPPSALDRYIQEAIEQPASLVTGGASAGSLWSPSAPLGDVARDLRASQIDDLVTILVSERASAAASGNTKSSRQSGVKAGITSAFGPANARLADLAKVSSSTSLDGQGATSRESILTATLTARVTQVLPSGYMVVEGVKDTIINSERQMITVRGVIRPADVAPGNVIRSDRLANLEVRINGKGVVNDAIRRPFFLYRLLMNLLPF